MDYPTLKHRNRSFDREGVDQDTGIDFGARYKVAAMPGVAFYLVGYSTEWTEERYTLDCDENSQPDGHVDSYGEHPPYCYLYDEPEEVENKATVRAVMVGDDTVHIVDVEDLTVITDYCSGCGAIDCEGDFRHSGEDLDEEDEDDDSDES